MIRRAQQATVGKEPHGLSPATPVRITAVRFGTDYWGAERFLRPGAATGGLQRTEVLLELGAGASARARRHWRSPSTDKLTWSRPWCAWLGRQLLRSSY
jgi:hypothetical protein